jgi:hypothetical protein
MSSSDPKLIPIPVREVALEGHLLAAGQWLVRLLPDRPPGLCVRWIVLTTKAQFFLVCERHNSDPAFVEFSVFDRLADLAGWPTVPAEVVIAAEKKLAELEIRRDVARDFMPPDQEE